jgi:hypothetical protein
MEEKSPQVVAGHSRSRGWWVEFFLTAELALHVTVNDLKVVIAPPE